YHAAAADPDLRLPLPAALPTYPPRASAKAIAGGSSSTTVVPVRRRGSCPWPTRTPRIAVSVRFDAMAPLPESRKPSELYLTDVRSEEHTSELQSPDHLLCRPHL